MGAIIWHPAKGLAFSFHLIRRDTAFSINCHTLAVKTLFDFLIDRGVVPNAILRGLAYVEEAKLLPKYTLHHEEVMRMLSRIPCDTPLHVRDRAILEVVYSSGIRREELANLALEDLDLEGGLIRIRAGKGGKDRMAPIGEHAVEWTRRYLVSSRPGLLGRLTDHAHEFVSTHGLPLHPDAVTLIVKRWGRSTGLEKVIGPHTLGRSCATELIRNGANPAHVKDILGHEDFSSLSAYVKLEVRDLKDALARYHPRER